MKAVKILTILAASLLLLLPNCKTSRSGYKKEIGGFKEVLGKQWNLIELNRKPFKDTISGKTPFIIFRMEDSSMAGNGGCNDLYAKFLPAEENLLSIINISFTKMFCDNLIYEVHFIDALRLTDSWLLKHDTLFLLNGKKKNLTVFVRNSAK